MAHAPTATAQHRRALAVTLGFTAGFAVVEAVAGYLTDSLVLLADAGHMIADVGGLALALFASWMAQRKAPSSKTYGYYRVEILAALLNGVALFGLAFFILYEALERLSQPPEVRTGPMLIVAVLGLAVNLFGMWNLHEGSRESLNLKGAFLEVFSDMLGSLGAIAAGVIMWATQWYYADAIFSALIGVFILPRTWGIISQAVNVLLEATPSHVSLPAVEEAMRRVHGVTVVHDLHVWTITSGMDALSAHVVLAEACAPDAGFQLVNELRDMLKRDFRISHTTIQVERGDQVNCEACH
ncbi:MAG: cation diffusion facilitator family transporter [Gemmataceae bacterium]|nr:cation diffusion facilitator family transporter [Gemmataceae bacterium]